MGSFLSKTNRKSEVANTEVNPAPFSLSEERVEENPNRDASESSDPVYISKKNSDDAEEEEFKDWVKINVDDIDHRKKYKGWVVIKDDYEVTPPPSSFPGWTLINSKSGGANSAGPEGGEYQNDNDPYEIALFKRDTSATDGILVEKVIGENLAGRLLNIILKHTDKDKKIKIAQTNLVKKSVANESAANDQDKGENIYLQSIFIKDYKGDLWKYAYQQHYKQKYSQKIKKLEKLKSNEEEKLKSNEEEKLKSNEEEKLKSNEEIDKINEEIDKINEEIDKIKETWRTEIIKKYEDLVECEKQKLAGVKNNHINTQIKIKIEKLNNKISNFKKEMDAVLPSDAAVVYAKYKTDLLKRPSAILPDELQKLVSPILGVPSRPRAVVNKLIDDHVNLKEGFIKSAPARLLLGDFGQHNANYGVVEENNELFFANLDYGAAFENFSETVEPYTRRGKLVNGYHKNHFLEYSNELIKSEAMAKSFIEIGQMPTEALEELDKEINEALTEYRQLFHIEPLKKFCRRMKMDFNEKEEDKNELLNKMNDFLKSRLRSRCESLKNQGYGLLLEHCVEEKLFSRSINEKKLGEMIEKYAPDLKNYIQSNHFKNYTFKWRSATDLVRQRELKNKIAVACGAGPIYSVDIISPIVKPISPIVKPLISPVVSPLTNFFSPPPPPKPKPSINKVYPSLSEARARLAVFKDENSKEAKELAKITAELQEIYARYNIKY